MSSLTIAVSGINSIDNPGAGIGIIRSLKEANPDFQCIGLSYDAMDPGLYLDQYVDRAYLLPYPSASREKYLERLFYVCEKEKVDVIIPAFDSELPHYIQNRGMLDERNIRLLLPTRAQFERTQKVNLPALGERLGLRVPVTRAVTTLEELNAALDFVGLPAMIKGVFYEAYCAHSFFDAHHYFHRMAVKWGFPVLVQQYVSGHDFNLVGLAGRGGTNLGLVPIKKLLLTQLGKIWTAITIDNPQMVEVGKRFVEETHFTGGFELEFRMTESEELYLLEINPRFPAWVYLATAAGMNLPMRYVSNVTKGEYEYGQEYEVGKMLVRYTGELIRDLSHLEFITINGEKSPPSFPSPLGGEGWVGGRRSMVL